MFMKKSILSLVLAAGVLTSAAPEASAQYDASQWPAKHLDPQFDYTKIGGLRKPKGIYKYIPQPYVFSGKEADLRGPDRLLNAENGIEIINITPYSPDQSETWMVINPNNPNVIVTGSNDSRYNGGANRSMSAQSSTDGGKTWRTSTTPPVPTSVINFSQGTNFDPCFAFDSKGNVYYIYGIVQTLNGDLEGGGGILVARSSDNGATWLGTDWLGAGTDGPNPVTWHQPTGGSLPFDDRYWAAGDANPNSPYKDHIYVAWRRFIQAPGMYVSRSSDQGRTWSTPFAFSNTSGGTQHANVTVGPDGEVYVTYSSTQTGRTGAAVQVSTDGGTTWISRGNAQQVVNVGTFNSSSGRNVLAAKQGMRISSYPSIAVDNSNGPNRGRVYVVQSGKSVTDTREGIWLCYSDNKGQTWTPTRRIDDNVAGSDVFMPAISVDPVTGTVAVFYYSSQNDAGKNQGVDAYYALSGDGGETWSQVRITPQSWFIDGPEDISNQGTGNIYWGDYVGVAAHGGKVYSSFWMPNGPNGSWNSVDLYAGILTIGPNPPAEFAVANNFQAPTQGVLTWVDPDKTTTGQALTDFTIVIRRNGQELATVEKGVQTYTDNTLVDGEEYTYEILARTPAGLNSPVRSYSFTAGGALKPAAPVLLSAKPTANGIAIEWTNPAEHVDGSPFHDFSSVAVFSKGQEVARFAAPDEGIQAGSSSVRELEIDTERFYEISLAVVGERGTTETFSDTTSVIVAYAGAPLATFSTEFAATDSIVSWTNGAWAVSDERFASAPTALASNPKSDYSGSANNSVIFAPHVVQEGATTLSFDHIGFIRSGDMGTVQISNDFGKTWNALLFVNRERRAQAWGTNTPLEDAQFYTEGLDASAYVGDTVYVRFLFQSNAFANDKGWYVDNLRFDGSAVSVREENTSENGVARLGMVYPNPASGAAQVSLELLAPVEGTVEVFDSFGRRVAQVSKGRFEAGRQDLRLDASSLAPGIYFVGFTGNGSRLTVPFTVVR